jgi:hypothetical protein
MGIFKWVAGHYLPVKVKMDGAVGHGFGVVSEQLVLEVVSEIWDAVNRMNDVIILVIICSNVAVLNTQMATLK